jgi:small multidrug resistance family-3 protein
MTVLRSIGLFVLAAIAEIGGAWLVWQGFREKRGLAYIGAGVIALGLYGFFATLPTHPPFRTHPRRLRRSLRPMMS